MPLIGFSVFKEKIRDGSKRQTIRSLRKHPIKKDDTLYLYWKLRTKECELLRVEKCIEEFTVTMQFYEDWLNSGTPVWRVDVKHDEHSGLRVLIDSEVEDLARRDGFENAHEMMKWFANKHGNLNGKVFQVIRW